MTDALDNYINREKRYPPFSLDGGTNPEYLIDTRTLTASTLNLNSPPAYANERNSGKSQNFQKITKMSGKIRKRSEKSRKKAEKV